MQTKDTPDYSGHRFLIVDDKQFLRNLIHGMLVECRAGDLKHASDGGDAIGTLVQNRGEIDCVLCDWNMEPMSGLELLRAIRAGEVENTPRDLRFIMLTGYGDENVVKSALDMDINGYVVKPVSMGKLIQAIDAAFARPSTVKAESFYQSVPTIVLPGAPTALGKPLAPWGSQPKMHAKLNGPLPKAIGSLERSVVHEQTLVLDLIRPGKVLAQNIVTEDGRLLLARGTVLDQWHLGRLRELAGDKLASSTLLIGDYGD